MATKNVIVAGVLLHQTRSAVVGRCRLTLSKLVLKAPGNKRLKLLCDGPLSNFAFKFKLRRYTKDQCIGKFGAKIGGQSCPDALNSRARQTSPATSQDTINVKKEGF